MKRLLLALAMGVLLLLLVGVGTAAANPPASQSSGQSAGGEQDAWGAAGTAQQEPTKGNTPVRVLSPGDEGSVSQSNEASSNATAANLNGTEQDADQEQAGGSGLQAIGQSAEGDQDAFSLASTLQQGASNENAPVDVLSPGDGGSVSQSNVASSQAASGNTNATEQEADQAQAGDSCNKCGGAGTQLVGQSADNEQKAAALSATQQEEPSNSNVSVRVLSPGDEGSVSQSNEASSNATAANLNGTEQDADQEQAGGSGLQAIGQSADNDQEAHAASLTGQKGATNENVSVRVLSPGDGGSVSQSNVASSEAESGNTNATEQEADQAQAGDSCKCGSSGSQVIGQSADNEQDATALSTTHQETPSNSNISVRVLSPGDDARVSQSNEASSEATAANLNGTKQDADQAQAGGSGLQAIGQSADSEQKATALSATQQEKPSNSNIAVRVLSPGHGGSVSQSNVASSDAKAGNTNWTGQDADQTHAGHSCKCGSAGTQLVGQSADNDQKAAALSATVQEKPSNSNVPVRVLSPGDDGRVSQSNEASSEATAANLNGTKQDADQAQADGSGLQVIGQSADNEQTALAIGLTLQAGASNENAPVRVLSPGDGGSVSQSNVASSNADAGNTNWTGQDADQSQSGKQSLDRGCCGTAIQAIGQLSENRQGATALAVTLQLGLKPPCKCNDSGIGNSNEPVRVLSPGDDGSVRQLNEASSEARAVNWNATKQDADQIQAHRCRCKAGREIQAIGQLDKSSQLAAAIAATLQLGAANEWAPDRKESPGRSGDLTQIGKDAASDASGSRTATDQSKSQIKR